MTILLWSVIVPAIMLYIAIFVRRAPKSLHFSYMVLSLLFFNMGYLFELSGGTYESALLAAKIEYLGAPFIAPFLVLFVLEYCARITVKLKHILILMIIPITAAILVFTWPLTDIFYKYLLYDTGGVVPRFIVTGGVVYYLYFSYTYILVFCSLFIVLYYRKKGNDRFKKQANSLVVATILPVVGVTINILQLGNLPIDVTSVLLTCTCVLLAHSVTRQGLYSLAPIAQEQIVENMNDGLILVDVQGAFIDANPAAKKLFPQLRNMPSGAGMPVISEITWNTGDSDVKREFSVTTAAGAVKHYQASQNFIINNGRTIGRSIIVYDITEAKERLDEVRHIAEHDALTGLINRGTLYGNGKSIFDRFGAKASAAVLMMDIDHFKKINDTYGHLNGDEVLKQVANTLVSNLRATDLVGRYGGEEFCVFLPRIDADYILILAEKLRASIENLELILNGQKVKITISIGVAVYDYNRHNTFEAFLSDADVALYEAKNSGRNCVKRFTEK